MRLVSLFSGAGGLDLGFEQAGFDVIWANEFDRSIWDTYRKNFPSTQLDTRSIVEINAREVPDCDGMIGGPPCQSWSEAGARRGIRDQRGQLFYEYIRLLDAKRPKFFLAENVSGILFGRHSDALARIFSEFTNLGYNISYGLLNASDFGVPQDRERVIIIGYRSSLQRFFMPPIQHQPRPTLRDAIWDLRNSAQPTRGQSTPNSQAAVANHEYMTGGFSAIFMSRNRVRDWDSPSFTVQAGARHAPLHPQAPPMPLVGKDKRIFEPGAEHLYRRLSVRECARVQTFPDEYEFVYSRISHGYKMIGNAVPVEFARRLAERIRKDLKAQPKSAQNRKGAVRTFEDLASSEE
jgi:DNA (cytosine-5)-methyltransferase 1